MRAHPDVAVKRKSGGAKPTKLECLHCAASRALLTHFRERLREAITTEEFLLARVAALEALLPRPVLDGASPSSPTKGCAPAADAIIDLQSCEASAIKPQQDSPMAVSSDKIVRARPHADHSAPAEEARTLWADRDPATSQAAGPGAVAGGKGPVAAAPGGGTLFTPDPTAIAGPGTARAGAGLGVRLHVDTSSSSIADAGTSDTLMLLEQVLQGDNRLIARTPAPVRFRRSIYHPDLSLLLQSAAAVGHGFSGLRSPPWQASYGGMAPDGHVLFSPLAASQHQHLQIQGGSGGEGSTFAFPPNRGALVGPGGAGAADKARAAAAFGNGGQTPPVPELLELVPPSEWVRDEDAPACQGETCGAAFGVFLRRHHCRACGGIFCDACSRHTLRLEHGPSRFGRRRPVPAAVAALRHRVCDECYAVATQQ